jgi:hypothetical protein
MSSDLALGFTQRFVEDASSDPRLRLVMPEDVYA